jgi:glycerol-3-phosphate dehydrogenase (NAD(P)+)
VTRFSVIGSGAMGCAVAYLLSNNGHQVLIWTRRPEVAESINHSHRNDYYLPGVHLNLSISATTSLEETMDYSENLILAVPSSAINEIIKKLEPYKRPKKILSVIKGVDLQNKQRISQTFTDSLEFSEDDYAVLSGPNFASELVINMPSITVVASKSRDTAGFFKESLVSKNLVIEITHDVTGVEISSVLKNIFALAMGIVDGLGFGSNTRGAIFTQCIRDAQAIGGVGFNIDNNTIYGPACLGDAITTGFSTKSRNYLLGLILAKSSASSPMNSFISEGKNNISFVKEIIENKGIVAPSIDFIHRIIEGENAYKSFSIFWEYIHQLNDR